MFIPINKTLGEDGPRVRDCSTYFYVLLNSHNDSIGIFILLRPKLKYGDVQLVV